MNESLILVDLFDHELGAEEKLAAHQNQQLHRAFSVFLHHNGKMLLQRRALHKYHSGGLWANACCSHPRYGMTFEDSVVGRLQEELGITPGSCSPRELFSFVYFCPYDGLSEYEYDHVLLAEYDGPFCPDPEEIMDLRWISFEDLKKELEQNPTAFAAWFLIAAPKVLEYLSR